MRLEDFTINNNNEEFNNKILMEGLEELMNEASLKLINDIKNYYSFTEVSYIYSRKIYDENHYKKISDKIDKSLFLTRRIVEENFKILLFKINMVCEKF